MNIDTLLQIDTQIYNFYISTTYPCIPCKGVINQHDFVHDHSICNKQKYIYKVDVKLITMWTSAKKYREYITGTHTQYIIINK